MPSAPTPNARGPRDHLATREGGGVERVLQLGDQVVRRSTSSDGAVVAVLDGDLGGDELLTEQHDRDR